MTEILRICDRNFGRLHPVVKKVKIQKKQTSGVFVNGGNGIAKNGDMVRIDVFCVNKKYYFVPVYTADVVKKVLPNKAATAHKPYREWRVMEDKDFLFSLYPKDLVHIRSKKGVKASLTGDGQSMQNERYAYCKGANIANANIEVFAHDNKFEVSSLGIQSLEVFEKYQVDILGNKTAVRREMRMGFS